MINMSIEIINALENDTKVASFVGNKVYRLVVPQQFSEDYPYLRVTEINNVDSGYADDEAIASDIFLQIDCWSKGDPDIICQEIDRVMKANNFKRYIVTEDYEQDTGAFRKMLRYRTTKRI